MRGLKSAVRWVLRRLFQGWRFYWVIYYLTFVVGVLVWGWPIWTAWKWSYLHAKNPAFGEIVDVYGMSAGTAVLVAIFLEVGGRIVLLIKPAVEALLEKGREEGREEGRREGREEGIQEGVLARDAEWSAWNVRRLEAESRGERFDEPPPSERK